MPGRRDEKTGSAFTRMWVDVDLGNLNVRREQLSHLVHYKHAVHMMKVMARKLGRPINILNLGCGEANELRMFYAADHSKKRDIIESYVGLEGDASCVRRAEEKAATVLRGCNARLEVCDISQGIFPVDPATIDLIICNEVLEHVPFGTVPKILKGAHRALRKKGRAVFSTPNKDGTNDRLPADHVYEYGYDEIHQLFVAGGFDEVDELGVYIKRSNFSRWVREHYDAEAAAAVEKLWDRYGLDIASLMTADMAKPVANNLIHVLRKTPRKVSNV